MNCYSVVFLKGMGNDWNFAVLRAIDRNIPLSDKLADPASMIKMMMGYQDACESKLLSRQVLFNTFCITGVNHYTFIIAHSLNRPNVVI